MNKNEFNYMFNRIEQKIQKLEDELKNEFPDLSDELDLEIDVSVRNVPSLFFPIESYQVIDKLHYCRDGNSNTTFISSPI